MGGGGGGEKDVSKMKAGGWYIEDLTEGFGDKKVLPLEGLKRDSRSKKA